jgi:uncharacterized membrane protein YeaQ/YmgE (transglycosylase-associated protein family)
MNLDVILNHPNFHQFILWTGLGLGVGIAAKILLPGSENMGWIRTILLGLAGCFLGNFTAPKLFDWAQYSTFSWQGIGIGVLGAMVLVLVNKLVTKT